MRASVRKIEILNEKDFDRLIEEYDVERFSCSGDKINGTGNILRMAIYANYDMFDELVEQLINSDYGFRIYGGDKNKQLKYVLLEVY